MSTAAHTDTADQRAALYAGLSQRNRLVRLLRLGLPAIGAVILLGLMLQFYIGSLVPDLGFANITIDRENLIVEAPVYSGVGTDGTTYAVSAATARTAFGNMDIIDLTDALFSFDQPGGELTFTASAGSARLQVSDQTVHVDGVTHVAGSDGLHGTVADARVDVTAERLVSQGDVDLTFAGGANVRADTMHYDGTGRLWTFERATVWIPATPGEQVPRPPGDLSR